jgi:hypothetical protein
VTGTAPATQVILHHPDRATRLRPSTGVTRIGVTGHRTIPPAAQPAVRAGLRALFHGRGDDAQLEALTSLAAGADQLFADIALAHGVPVTAVIPGMDYEAHLGDAATVHDYRRILRSCTEKVQLPPEPTHEEAYFAAGPCGTAARRADSAAPATWSRTRAAAGSRSPCCGSRESCATDRPRRR